MLTKKKDSISQVNSNGFALFVIGLTLAGFLGGAMRLFLNSDRAQARIISEVQKKFPEWNVTADRVELHLSSGIWPGVTVELARVQGFRKVDCGRPELRISADTLKIPVGLWSMVAGQNKLGFISMERMDIEILEKSCAPVRGGNSSVSKSGENKNSKKTLKDIAVATTSSLDLSTASKNLPSSLGLRAINDEIRERVEGLKISELTVSGVGSRRWSFKMSPLVLDVGSPIVLQGGLSVWSQFDRGEIRQDFTFKTSLSGPLLEWTLKTAVKEGSITWSGQVDEESKTFLHRLRVHQVPFADLLTLAYTAGELPGQPQAKRVWLNCELVQGGSFSNLDKVVQVPAKVETCRLDGEIGSLSVRPQIFYLREPHFRSGSMVIEGRKISLDLIFEALSLAKMEVVFSRLGTWSGVLELVSMREMILDGELETIKVNVSHKSLRGQETVQSVKTYGHWTEPQLKLKLEEFVVLGGSRDGSVQLDYSFADEKGDFTVQFEALSLSSPIQKLLLQGNSSPLKIQMQGRLESEELKTLKGEVFSESLSGLGWSVSGVQGRFHQVKPQVFELEMMAKDFVWEPSFQYSPLIDESRVKLGLEETTASAMSDLSMKLLVDESGGKVKKTSAKYGKSKLLFEGGWARGGRLNGNLKANSGKSTSLLF